MELDLGHFPSPHSYPRRSFRVSRCRGRGGTGPPASRGLAVFKQTEPQRGAAGLQTLIGILRKPVFAARTGRGVFLPVNHPWFFDRNRYGRIFRNWRRRFDTGLRLPLGFGNTQSDGILLVWACRVLHVHTALFIGRDRRRSPPGAFLFAEDESYPTWRIRCIFPQWWLPGARWPP